VNFVRLIAVFIRSSSLRNRKLDSYCSQIMSYIFNMLIRACMILLDNLLQCLLFIAMIDLSGTYDTVTSLIYYALVMFMIYSWIKIKPKVLIYQSGWTSHALAHHHIWKIRNV
jgi:hypothetical protein